MGPTKEVSRRQSPLQPRVKRCQALQHVLLCNKGHNISLALYIVSQVQLGRELSFKNNCLDKCWRYRRALWAECPVGYTTQQHTPFILLSPIQESSSRSLATCTFLVQCPCSVLISQCFSAALNLRGRSLLKALLHLGSGYRVLPLFLLPDCGSFKSL